MCNCPGIEEVSKQDPHLFNQNVDKQFRGEDFFDSKMTVITNKKTALEALETIVDQGEGSIGVPNSHYSIFVELYQVRKEWTIINYIEEPRTEKYVNNKVAYHVSSQYCTT